jgi:hypothetical protein
MSRRALDREIESSHTHWWGLLRKPIVLISVLFLKNNFFMTAINSFRTAETSRVRPPAPNSRRSGGSATATLKPIAVIKTSNHSRRCRESDWSSAFPLHGQNDGHWDLWSVGRLHSRMFGTLWITMELLRGTRIWLITASVYISQLFNDSSFLSVLILWSHLNHSFNISAPLKSHPSNSNQRILSKTNPKQTNLYCSIRWRNISHNIHRQRVD